MKYLLPTISFLFLSLCSSAQITFKWSRIADYPAAHWGMNACVMNNYLYSFGACGAGSKVLYKYDLVADRWDSLSTFSGSSVCFTGLAGVDNKLYLSHNNGIHIYDVVTGVWNSTPISYPSGFEKSGTYEIVSGTDIYYIAGNGSKNMFKMNTTTQTFSKLADLKSGRDLPQATMLNGKIYVFGGRRNGVSLTTAEVYDIANDSWEDLTAAVSNRYFGHAINDGRYIYIMGGEIAGGSKKYKSIEMFDPAANTVTILDTAVNDMNHEHTAFAFGQIGDVLIAAGGYSNTPTLDFVTKYSEATDFKPTSVRMQVLNEKTSFKVYPNPAQNTIHIRFSQPGYVTKLELRNVLGILVATLNVNGNHELSIDCSDMPAGNYILKAIGVEAAQSQQVQIIK